MLKTIIINLEKRKDRWEKVIQGVERFGIKEYTRFNAIEGGRIGFNHSMYKCIQMSEMTLILEDDCYFEGTLKDLIVCLGELPDNWDMLYLGATLRETAVTKFKSGAVEFTVDEDSNIYNCYWNAFRIKTDKIEGQEIKEPTNVIRYKIYKNGKPLKPKYFNDLGKIKSSLLIEIGYFDNQYEMFEKFKDRNPELQDNAIPEWLGGYGGYGPKFQRSDCDSLEIMSFEGKSRIPVKTDFDVLAYYDQSMRLINVTAQFGSAARELFKKCMETKEFSYMLVYSPDEYRGPKDKYDYFNCDFESLKESQKIKDVMKASGVKGTKKCTKFGKTAIVFKSLADLKNVMLRLEPKEYFILDCDGEQLVEKNTRFVKLIMLQEVANQED